MTGYVSSGGKNRVDFFPITSNAFGTLAITVDSIAMQSYTGAPGVVGFEMDFDQIRHDPELSTFLGTYASVEKSEAEKITLIDGQVWTAAASTAPTLGMITYLSHVNGKVETIVSAIDLIVDGGPSVEFGKTTRRPLKVRSVKPATAITVGSDLFDTDIIDPTTGAISGDISLAVTQSGTSLWADEA